MPLPLREQECEDGRRKVGEGVKVYCIKMKDFVLYARSVTWLRATKHTPTGRINLHMYC